MPLPSPFRLRPRYGPDPDGFDAFALERQPPRTAAAIATVLAAPDERTALALLDCADVVPSALQPLIRIGCYTRGVEDAFAHGHVWTPLLDALHQAGMWPTSDDWRAAPPASPATERHAPEALLAPSAAWFAAASPEAIAQVLQRFTAHPLRAIAALHVDLAHETTFHWLANTRPFVGPELARNPRLQPAQRPLLANWAVEHLYYDAGSRRAAETTLAALYQFGDDAVPVQVRRRLAQLALPHRRRATRTVASPLPTCQESAWRATEALARIDAAVFPLETYQGWFAGADFDEQHLLRLAEHPGVPLALLRADGFYLAGATVTAAIARRPDAAADAECLATLLAMGNSGCWAAWLTTVSLPDRERALAEMLETDPATGVAALARLPEDQRNAMSARLLRPVFLTNLQPLKERAMGLAATMRSARQASVTPAR